MTGAAVQERPPTSDIYQLILERVGPNWPHHIQHRDPRNYYGGQCPFPGCGDTYKGPRHRPTFTISQDGKVCGCFSCGQGGGYHAVRRILGEAPITPVFREPKKAAAKRSGDLVLPDGCSIDQLAQARGLDAEWLKREMGWRDTYWPPYAREQCPAILMPYGNIVRYRVSLGGDRFRWQKGATTQLYGLEHLEEIRRKGWVILVEGETDTAALTYHDFPVLGVPGKTNWKPAWAGLLEGLSVFLWQEPNAEEFTESVGASIPDILVVEAPPMAKDPCELAHLCGDRFPEVMGDLLDRANTAADSLGRPPGAEMGTYLSTREKVFNKGWRSAWKILDQKREQLLRSLPRSSDTAQKRYRDLRDCGKQYQRKKCRHLGEEYMLPFHCQDPSVCVICARAESERFWQTKAPMLEDVENLQLWIIGLGSYWLPDGEDERIQAIRDHAKAITKWVQQFGVNQKGKCGLASNHFRSLQTEIRGDLVSHQLVFGGLPEPGAAAQLQEHFQKRTGVLPSVRTLQDLDPEGFREEFTEITAIRCDWDTAENFLQWRTAFKHFHVVQAKGDFRNLAGSKAPMPSKAERERRKSISCLICGDCEPLDLGFCLIADTPTMERTSEHTGKKYLEAIDDG